MRWSCFAALRMTMNRFSLRTADNAVLQGPLNLPFFAGEDRSVILIIVAKGSQNRDSNLDESQECTKLKELKPAFAAGCRFVGIKQPTPCQAIMQILPLPSRRSPICSRSREQTHFEYAPTGMLRAQSRAWVPKPMCCSTKTRI